MNDIERWRNPEQRKIIEDAIHDCKPDNFHTLLWCVEGAPWEEYAKNHIVSVMRAKVFFDNVPRFV